MNKITNLLKSLLVVAALGMGSTSAWAKSEVWIENFESATTETLQSAWIKNNDATWGATYSPHLELANNSYGNSTKYLFAYDTTTNRQRTAYYMFGSAYTGTAYQLDAKINLNVGNSAGESRFYIMNGSKAGTNVDPSNYLFYIGGNTSGYVYVSNGTDTETSTIGNAGTSENLSQYQSKSYKSTGWFNVSCIIDMTAGKVKVTITKGVSEETFTINLKSGTKQISGFGICTGKALGGSVGLDDMALYSLTYPEFTLSSDAVESTVGGNATVNVTGITGTITVESSNTSVATASYADGVVTINGVADGVTDITVNSTSDGVELEKTITVTVGSVATTTVTINYKSGDTSIADPITINDVTIGSTLTASDITYDDVVYGTGVRYVNPTPDQTIPYTVVENGVINVNYTQQNAVSSLNVYAIVNSTNYLLKSYDLDGKYVGDAVTVTCPEYYLLDGTLYSTANHGSGGYYKWSHTLTGSDLEVTYGTTAATNVVYYAEAENIEGATANSSSNADIRCSEATGAYFGAETNIVTLPAANYTIYTQVWGGAGTTFTFKAGEETIHEHTTTGALNPKNTSFLLTKAKTITVSASGSSGKVLDLVYLVRTGDAPTDTYTAQYYNSACWENVYAYTYGDETLGAWPGTKLTATDGVFDVSFEAAAAPDGIIFNNGDDKQTADLAFVDGASYNSNGRLYNYTATFTTNLGWENVYAYVWSGENESKVEQLGAWPGTEITATKGIYTVDFMANSVPEYIIFNNNSGSQTSDLAFVDGDTYSWNNYTVKFNNTGSWANVYAWIWNGTSTNLNAPWPGTKLSESDGLFTFTYTGTAAPDHILFNNNDGNQTDDLDFIDGTTYNASGDITVSKTISAAGWATYCSPYALDFTNAIANLDAAYIVTGGAGGVLEMTEVTGIVPANTGLLLKGEGDVAFPVASSDANVDVSANKLEGVTENTVIAAEAGYVLMASPSLGFYKNSNAFTVGANTAYLPADFDVTSARFFLLDGGKTTSISEQLTVNCEKLVYDLQGRRVNSSLKPGLYIMSGKKVVIK